MREDVILELQRKSELACILFKSKGKGRFDSSRFGRFVDVTSTFRPRVAPVPSLVNTVKGSVSFREGRRDERMVQEGRDTYVITVDSARAISRKFAEQRQRREKKRAAARARQRDEERRGKS